MAQSEPYDSDEPVRRSGIGRFFSGAILGLLVCVLVAIGLTLSFPLPEDLPGVGTVRVEGSGAPEAPAEDGDQVQEQATAQSDGDDAGTSGEPDGADAASGEQDPNAFITEDQGSSTTSGEAPAAGQSDDTGTGTDVATDQDAGPEVATGPDEVSGSDETAGSDEVAAVSPDDPAGDAVELPAGEISLSGPALEVNARPFEAPAGAPLLAVVLTDAGNGTIEPDTLPLLTMPLTLAIDPAGANGATLATAARTAKHEVLVQLPFARSAEETGAGVLHAGMSVDEIQDLTVRNLAALPEALGATPRKGAQMLGERDAMQAVIAPLKQHGFAYVDQLAGSGSVAGELAVADGVFYAETNRVVPAASNGDQIFSSLENAAFQARQKGTAIVEITTGPDALTALLRWGLEKDRRPVWFAPVSAVLKRRAEAE